ncbi:lysophospholipid acyltransferase family protein [Thiocystis violascens]|uniref:1-acyl-sn-glycerol-3-phosphate acyltransferase n=1 Tax=Thiocystis violascens (strain ATCC 17096 / DSM 198 / 6111) TaxID=765911 RepID=I3YF52_THIV6|nr:lysophospholipid acyltransferase family protein [Thiocystis violascens]AFL75620.1 1-acyl-sn-glycerol-3-phosphate acyltransferase [Thiocystis violascens DSM 198]
MMAKSLWRSLRVIEHLTTGAIIALYIRLRSSIGRRPVWVPQAVHWWHARLCRALGLRLRIVGRVEPGCLLVGNHISWLDIPIVGAQHEIAFLSKSEVRGWPLIGWMAEIAGTLFIERGAHQADRIAACIVAEVARGHPLMIFPEGTTSEGHCVRRFHPRLFSVAQDSGIRIQPVAIGYRRGEDPTPDPHAPYVDDDTLIANLWQIIRHPDLVAHIQFLPPLRADDDATRRSLAESSRLAIVTALGLDPENDRRRGHDRPETAPASGESTLSSPDPSPA